MTAPWRDPLLSNSYIISSAISDFGDFVVSTSANPGWQGRLAQRWNREMAHLIEFLKSQGSDDNANALNYVYKFKRDAKEKLEALPGKDPRRAYAEDLDGRLVTPQVFQKSKDRISLNQALKEFSEDAVRIAVRGWKNWEEDLTAKWIIERAAMSTKTAATQKNYISKYRKAVEEELEREFGVVESSEQLAFLRLALSTQVEAVSGEVDPDQQVAAVDEEGELQAQIADAEATLALRRKKVEGLLPDILKIVAHIQELNDAVNKAYGTTVRSQVRNLQLIENWKELVEAFTLFLKDDNPRLKLIGLMGLTGRRFFEVCVSGDFTLEIHEDKHATIKQKWVLRFIGQAKTRGSEGTRSEETYNIPCLAPAKDIYRAFQQFRNSPEGMAWSQMSSRELNAKVNNQINRYLRTSEDVVRAWPKGVKLTTKCLRSLYAEIAYKVYAPATMAKAPYFAQILGHSSEDLGTALSYMDYVLDVSDENEAREQMQALVDNINDQDAEFGNPYEAPAELEEEQAAPAPKSTGKDDGEVIDENDS